MTEALPAWLGAVGAFLGVVIRLSLPFVLMPHFRSIALLLATVLVPGCVTGSRIQSGTVAPASGATLAQVYFWRAKPGKFAEYTRYIRDVAEPIDREAQRAGAFLEVTTYAVEDTTLPWTHLRVFLLRDSTQLAGLGAALSAAGVRLQPDTARRRVQGEYSASLRDRVGATVTQLVR
ncbi:MAG: hypothetical protein ABIZ91_17035 [Gemmatimonadaceae bacterium]